MWSVVTWSCGGGGGGGDGIHVVCCDVVMWWWWWWWWNVYGLIRTVDGSQRVIKMFHDNLTQDKTDKSGPGHNNSKVAV